MHGSGPMITSSGASDSRETPAVAESHNLPRVAGLPLDLNIRGYIKTALQENRGPHFGRNTTGDNSPDTPFGSLEHQVRSFSMDAEDEVDAMLTDNMPADVLRQELINANTDRDFHHPFMPNSTDKLDSGWVHIHQDKSPQDSDTSDPPAVPSQPSSWPTQGCLHHALHTTHAPLAPIVSESSSGFVVLSGSPLLQSPPPSPGLRGGGAARDMSSEWVDVSDIWADQSKQPGNQQAAGRNGPGLYGFQKKAATIRRGLDSEDVVGREPLGSVEDEFGPDILSISP